eukprot:GHVQ01034546.1.p1 GENE.GHVQ01034546.1~~GHVQ01034546.1.p1  ORF type:complete len:139 (-),score=6.53 GHVQ01034546.1:104-520(-)
MRVYDGWCLDTLSSGWHMNSTMVQQRDNIQMMLVDLSVAMTERPPKFIQAGNVTPGDLTNTHTLVVSYNELLYLDVQWHAFDLEAVRNNFQRTYEDWQEALRQERIVDNQDYDRYGRISQRADQGRKLGEVNGGLPDS